MPVALPSPPPARHFWTAYRTLAFACAGVALAVLAAGTILSLCAAGRVREEAGTALQRTAQNLADRLPAELGASAHEIGTPSRRGAAFRPKDREALRVALEALRRALPADLAASRLWVLGPDGVPWLEPEPPAQGAAALALPLQVVRNLVGHWRVARESDGLQTISAAAEAFGAPDTPGFRVLARQRTDALDAAIASAQARVWRGCLAAGVLGTALAWGWVRRREMRPSRPGAGVFEDPGTGRSVVDHVPRRNDIAGLRLVAARPSEPEDSVGDNGRRWSADGPTALADRHEFERFAEAMDCQPAGVALDLCVLRIRLDDCDRLADAFGRAPTDGAQHRIVRRIAGATRDTDCLFRLADDEFLMLAPCPVGDGPAVARLLATRILDAINRPAARSHSPDPSLSGSVGTALWRRGCSPLTDAVAQAGEALDTARRAGGRQFRQYAARLSARQDAAALSTSPA